MHHGIGIKHFLLKFKTFPPRAKVTQELPQNFQQHLVIASKAQTHLWQVQSINRHRQDTSAAWGHQIFRPNWPSN
jgi:hypothetical protein